MNMYCQNAKEQIIRLVHSFEKSELMTFEQRRNMMKGFIETQFGYHPFTLMFYGKQTNVRINHIHKRTLKAVCNDERSPFEELLGRDKSETIHRRNNRTLAVELLRMISLLS